MTPAAERELLIQRFRALSLRRGGVATLLCGQPGVGKTHLAQTVLLHLGCRSLSVRATLPLRPLLLTLPPARQRPAWVEPVFEQVLRGELVAPTRVLDAVAAHLQAVAPLVLHVEDLHEAAPDQQAFWSALARATAHLRGVGLLATSRQEAPGFAVLPVAELSAGAAAELLEGEAGAPLPPAALAWIYGWARGNPLFTREYFRLLSRMGDLWSDGQVWRWRAPRERALPPTVEALISERLAGVGGEALRLLDALTLLPQEAGFGDAAVSADLTPEQASPAAETLTRAGILSQGGFAHPLYREVHGAAMSPQRQRQVAERALTRLADRPEWAARFADQAGLTDGQAAKLLRAAAASAHRRGDAEQEAQFSWEAALRLRGPRRAALARRAARVVAGVHQSLAVTYARASYEAAPGREGAFTLALCLARAGEAGEAQRVLERGRDDTAAWLQVALETQVVGGDDLAALQAWKRLSDLPPPTAAAHGLAASAFLNLGELDHARQTAQQGLGLCAASPVQVSVRVRLLSVLAGVAYFRGEFESATGWQAEAAELCLKAGQPVEAAGILGNRALVRAALGQPQLAADDLQEAMRLHASAGQGRQYAFQQQRLGALLARMGLWERAEEGLLDARAVLARTEMLGWQSECEGELAKLYLEWSPAWAAPRALRHARASLDLARRFQNPTCLQDALFVCGWAEAQHGTPETALALADELGRIAPAGPSLGRGYAHWAEGLARQAAGQTEEAREALGASLDTFREGRIEVLARRVAIDSGRLSDDEELVWQSVRYFEERGLHGRAAPGRRALHHRASGARGEPVQATGARPTLPVQELRLLGPPEVWSRGEKLAVRGGQSLLLLAALGEAAVLGQSEVAQEALTGLLYPNLPEKQAASALQQLIHRLRAVAGADFVQRGAGGYVLGPGVRIDAASFLETGDTALWFGPYLGEVALGGAADSPVARQLHGRLRSVLEASPSLPGARAVFLAELLLRAEPFEREVLRHALLAMKRERAYRKLDRTYRESVRLFAEVGETLPGRWQDFLGE